MLFCVFLKEDYFMKLTSKYIVILLIGVLFGCSKEKGAPEPVKLTPFEFKVSTI